MNTNAKLSRSLACAAFLTIAGAAMAADDYFGILGIPDNDQRRAFLPNNGNMYCAPTSAYNLIDYMGTHGIGSFRFLPVLDPGNTIYQSNPYLARDLRIWAMGMFMDTDPQDGTNGSGYTNGIIDYIDYVSNVPLMEISYNRDDLFPSPGAMSAWMKMGALVAFCYGRYTNPNGFNKDRDGGHCVTLTSVYDQWNTPNLPGMSGYWPTPNHKYQIGYNDPWADEGSGVAGYNTMQSPWAKTTRNVYPEYANFDGTETVLYGIGAKPTEAGKKYAYIDGYRILFPMVCLTNVKKQTAPGVSEIDGYLRASTALNFDRARGIWDIKTPGSFDMAVPFDSKVGDFALDPVLPSLVRTMPDDTTIYQDDYIGSEERARPIAKATLPPIALEYGGRRNDLFVLQRDRLQRLSRKNEWTGEKRFGTVPEALAYDPDARQVVVVSGPMLEVIDAETMLSKGVFEIPELRGEGKLSLRIDGKTGELLAMRRGLPAVQRLRRRGKGYRFVRSIPLGGAVAPTSFDVDRKGQLYVSDEGRIKGFDGGGRPINVFFAGMAAGDIVKLTRTFDNYDRAEHAFPNWRDVVNPFIPDADRL